MAPVAPLEKEQKPKELDYLTGDGKPMAETDLHRDQMIYSITALQLYYRQNQYVYVSGNNFLHYVEGNLRKYVSPDVYVVYGVQSYPRDAYKVWQENGILPRVVIEFTSKSTRNEDSNKKYPLYEQTLKVDEYFQYDPTGDYLNPRLQGFRLERGSYRSIPLENGDRLYSRNLDLFLVMLGEDFRFYDAKTGQFLKTSLETQNAYHDTLQAFEQTQRAYEEEQQLRRLEAERAQNAEEENARLRAELEQLKQGGSAT